jgi:hypothetical protein
MDDSRAGSEATRLGECWYDAHASRCNLFRIGLRGMRRIGLGRGMGTGFRECHWAHALTSPVRCALLRLGDSERLWAGTLWAHSTGLRTQIRVIISPPNVRKSARQLAHRGQGVAHRLAVTVTDLPWFLRGVLVVHFND